MGSSVGASRPENHRQSLKRTAQSAASLLWSSLDAEPGLSRQTGTSVAGWADPCPASSPPEVTRPSAGRQGPSSAGDPRPASAAPGEWSTCGGTNVVVNNCSPQRGPYLLPSEPVQRDEMIID